MSSNQKILKLFENATRILRDECPADNEAYVCARSEDYDPDMCTTCWENYLRSVVNG